MKIETIAIEELEEEVEDLDAVDEDCLYFGIWYSEDAKSIAEERILEEMINPPTL